MKDSELINIHNAVLILDNALSCKLQALGRAASERLGYDVVADLCQGGEIEFRRIMDDGVADSDSCIRLEDIVGYEYITHF